MLSHTHAAAPHLVVRLPGRFIAVAAEPLPPRVWVGASYWPSPGLQWIVLGVHRHARGHRIEFMERWTGGEGRVRTQSLGYLEFCARVKQEP